MEHNSQIKPPVEVRFQKELEALYERWETLVTV